VTLGSDLTAALPELREAAESMMTDACRIAESGGNRTLNEATGKYDTAGPVYIYAGRCQIKWGGTAPRDVDAAGQSLVESAAVVKLPMAASADVRVGDELEVTASASDPALSGMRFRIAGSFQQTYATARRFPIELVSEARRDG
jgi:hypothetical protein